MVIAAIVGLGCIIADAGSRPATAATAIGTVTGTVSGSTRSPTR